MTPAVRKAHTIRLDAKLLMRAKREAKRDRRSLNSFIVRAIQESVELYSRWQRDPQP